MAIRMTKPWRPLEETQVKSLPGQLGVYEIADAQGTVRFIGMAGGHSLFGLRSELKREVDERGGGSAWQFRVEVTMSYLTRYQELLMVHVADHGDVPDENRGALPVTLGRLHPA